MNLLPLSGSDGKAEAPFRARLESICGVVELHARFLNTLSLLEHTGSRKIMLARGAAPDGHMLQHLAEETRHAFFFKRSAQKLAQRSLDYSEACTLAGAAARFYMGRLDAHITSALRSGTDALPYLYTSLIIEDRAVWAYRIYQRVLDESDCGISLKSVLAEENLHLNAMLTQIEQLDTLAWDRIPRFCASEHAAFERLWNAIERACIQIRVAAA